MGLLRPVEPDDIQIFFAHQDDAEAAALAAFPRRDREAHAAHWARILADDDVLARTVLDAGQVAGNVVSFTAEGHRKVGYWLGRSFWGHGLGTAALAEFLGLVPARPLYADVAEHNTAGRKVLARNGFTQIGRRSYPDDEVVELEFRLD